jgi:hypothetical protein
LKPGFATCWAEATQLKANAAAVIAASRALPQA